MSPNDQGNPAASMTAMVAASATGRRSASVDRRKTSTNSSADKDGSI
jgi:hypothetical protein